MAMPTRLVLCMVGLPAVGKSTLAAAVADAHGGVVIDVDAVYANALDADASSGGCGTDGFAPELWRAARAEALDGLLAEALAADPDDGPRLVIVDDNAYYASMRRDVARRVAEAAERHNDALVLGLGYLYLAAGDTLDDAAAANAARTGLARVPDAVVATMAARFEPPTTAETHGALITLPMHPNVDDPALTAPLVEWLASPPVASLPLTVDGRAAAEAEAAAAAAAAAALIWHRGVRLRR
ncbi:uncharacterized protein AMSG_06408 [Thecamonas trahens ATCC 50062]|uniref:Uncharacterized protein n=1 Tax=Thecamonas trahens ATCC 50062 TaxID=461836 RepID=A0A0L0DD32_THETB|nr:hypothetical protein AMSG_06408 [Thecamonas trahens ATCC 50062]KNC50252.1 hypothetical protein AMSG_06408 [Thecamonas trahens ATCC 50062]|eukprot:XP_013757081.1 hypothetical protein AMSG_06408 [Thecamonas trahens ATCC 50062]